MRTIAIPLLTLAALCAARSASATEGTTGYAGKPYNGTTETCTTNCHGAGGPFPTLDITVPAAMQAGDTAEVTIVVKGTRARTSMNAALSDGVTATKGQNTEIPFPIQTPGEVAAASPPPNGQNGTYKFTFVAPQKNGPIMLWVAGMSANGSGTGGDGVTTATRTITISGATTTSNDAGAASDGGSGSGSPSPTDAGKKADGGAPSGEDDDDDRTTGNGRRLATEDDAGGCGASRSRDALPSAGAALIVMTFLGALRRRRAKR